MRSLEGNEQRLADVRASVAADKSSKNGTSPQKEPQPDNEQKEHDSHNADESQEPRNKARSQRIEDMSIHSQGDKTKSNKSSVVSKTSSVTRNLDLETKASKEQEELQVRKKKLRREAEEIEIADLQEELELARKTRITEKQIEGAKVLSSRASSLPSRGYLTSRDSR